MKANTIKPLEGNIWKYLHDLGIGKDFIGIKSTKYKTKLLEDGEKLSKQRKQYM